MHRTNRLKCTCQSKSYLRFSKVDTSVVYNNVKDVHPFDDIERRAHSSVTKQVVCLRMSSVGHVAFRAVCRLLSMNDKHTHSLSYLAKSIRSSLVEATMCFDTPRTYRMYDGTFVAHMFRVVAVLTADRYLDTLISTRFVDTRSRDRVSQVFLEIFIYRSIDISIYYGHGLVEGVAPLSTPCP
jgi:hypothetical protein